MDDIKRTPLSYAEYKALRQIFGMCHVFTSYTDDLKRRLHDVPGAWRDTKLVEKLIDKIMVNVLKTIPTEKLSLIQKELNSTHMEVKLINTVTPDDKTYTYVPVSELERVTSESMQVNCQFCDKCGKEARDCQLRKDITALYTWDFPKIPNGTPCYFASETMIGEVVKNDV